MIASNRCLQSSANSKIASAQRVASTVSRVFRTKLPSLQVTRLTQNWPQGSGQLQYVCFIDTYADEHLTTHPVRVHRLSSGDRRFSRSIRFPMRVSSVMLCWRTLIESSQAMASSRPATMALLSTADDFFLAEVCLTKCHAARIILTEVISQSSLFILALPARASRMLGSAIVPT